ncbi:unnamed protein product, partial [Didymodactylos carnosus]
FENEYYQISTSGTQSAFGVTTPRQKTSVTTLISWSKPLNDLKNTRQLLDIRNGKTIRDLLTDIRTGEIMGTVSNQAVLLMKRILDCTTDMLFTKMPALIQKIDDVMNIMNQYFRSFYNIDNIEDVVKSEKKERMP